MVFPLFFCIFFERTHSFQVFICMLRLGVWGEAGDKLWEGAAEGLGEGWEKTGGRRHQQGTLWACWDLWTVQSRNKKWESMWRFWPFRKLLIARDHHRECEQERGPWPVWFHVFLLRLQETLVNNSQMLPVTSEDVQVGYNGSQWGGLMRSFSSGYL